MEKPVYTVICTHCAREERLPVEHSPEGWDVVDGAAICPDCIDATVRLAPNLVSFDTGVFDGDGSTTFYVSATDMEPMRFTLAPRPEPAFSLCLAQSLPGQYSVALSPARVMTLYQPLAYLLDADEADELARQLHHYAEQARRPGTLGAAA
ncbi:hypothetical protein [Sphingobium lignivorans]|uniref:Uncharacterized protein n=1 Tax=Sphingobium lignivorans TaxID=2735886 RepID=A0ABR6NDK1_9SPHN|nr:hypothetical protein [Sphingobium lignivorans]MBB5985335.1 hypothetical protein [Sphingobium lignivorans]